MIADPDDGMAPLIIDGDTALVIPLCVPGYAYQAVGVPRQFNFLPDIALIGEIDKTLCNRLVYGPECGLCCLMPRHDRPFCSFACIMMPEGRPRLSEIGSLGTIRVIQT